MDWGKLITSDRFSLDDPTVATVKKDIAGAHQKDVDRILFSSAFRRMQGKAQVYILSESDYVRNRLTHTLEVNSISRILSAAIFRKMMNISSFSRIVIEKGLDIIDLVESVSAACLAHDIGNAPFGHIGEFAIRSWFKDNLGQRKHLALAAEKNVDAGEADQIRSSFENFDGNAQGLRVLTEIQGWKRKGGLQLTYTTLGSFMKYPFSAAYANERRGKFGYFYDQNAIVTDIAEKLGLKVCGDGCYARHPFSYIVEAADDIAYLTTDIEDGRRMDLIPCDVAVNHLKSIVSSARKSVNGVRYDSIKGQQDRVKYLRSAAMVALIDECSFAFENNIVRILGGEAPRSLDGGDSKDLIGATSLVNQCNNIRDMCADHLYYRRQKITKEAGAYEVVRSLLNLLSDAVENYFEANRNIDSMNDRNRNMLQILSKGKKVREMWPDGGWAARYPSEEYLAYITVLNFVAGMTDRYAAKLNRELTGGALLEQTLLI